MKIPYRNFCIYGLMIASLLGGGGCNLANIKAEQTSPSNQAKVEAKFNDAETAFEQNAGESNESQISAASVAGTYDYDTYDKGEGYDNSLEIKSAGGNKLYVFLSGSYIYKVGETQSFHEAEGKGDATLSGNVAKATLVDEAGKPCRATITFKKDEAAVKIPDSCQFNIELGGVYKKADSKVELTKKVETKNSNEVGYEKVMDFVNDFDAHRVGEEFVIRDVPTEILDKKTRADEFGNASFKNLYYLQGVTDDETPSYSFLTSKAMLESLTENAEYEPVILRMYAVNVESRGKFDVYRMPFITKIEALDSEGEIIWTAIGGKPAKLNYTH